MRNFKIDGIDEDLRAPHTPWIYYGVSMHLLPHFYIKLTPAKRDHMQALVPLI